MEKILYLLWAGPDFLAFFNWAVLHFLSSGLCLSYKVCARMSFLGSSSKLSPSGFKRLGSLEYSLQSKSGAPLLAPPAACIAPGLPRVWWSLVPALGADMLLRPEGRSILCLCREEVIPDWIWAEKRFMEQKECRPLSSWTQNTLPSGSTVVSLLPVWSSVS